MHISLFMNYCIYVNRLLDLKKRFGIWHFAKAKSSCSCGRRSRRIGASRGQQGRSGRPWARGRVQLSR